MKNNFISKFSNKKLNPKKDEEKDNEFLLSSPEKNKTELKLNQAYTKNYKETKNILAPNIQNNPLLKIFGAQKLFNFLGIPMKNRYDEINLYAKWWKFYDNLITLSNILIIILSFYDYEINFQYPRVIKANYTSTRFVMISLAFISIFCVFRRHSFKKKWRDVKVSDKDTYGGLSNSINKYDYEFKGNEEAEGGFYDENIEDMFLGDNRLDSQKENLFSKRLFFDLLVNIILPIPGLDFIINIQELDRDSQKLVNVEYLLSDFIYLILNIRFIFLFRAAINYSIFSNSYAINLCREYKVSNNIRFAIKCLLKKHHIKLVMFFFMGGLIIFAFMLRIVERPFWVFLGRIEFENYFIPLWNVFITMTTIGYGDFYPITLMGKIIVVFAALWGTFICSLIIVCLHDLLSLSNDQFNVFTKIVKSRSAMKFIESAYLLHWKQLKTSNIKESKMRYSYLHKEMIGNFYEFKNLRNGSKSIYNTNGGIYYNRKMIKEMKRILLKMDRLDKMIDETKKKI